MKKGGIYGADPTGNRVDARGANRSRGGLKQPNDEYSSGRRPQPAAGFSRWGKVPAEKRSPSLRRYHERKLEFLAAGLTVKGQPRKRVFKKYFTRAAKRAAANEQQRRWHAKKARENYQRGLTARGTVRVNRRFPELRGLASANRTEYSRQTYHVLKERKARTVIAALISGKANAGLLLQLKGGAR